MSRVKNKNNIALPYGKNPKPLYCNCHVQIKKTNITIDELCLFKNLISKDYLFDKKVFVILNYVHAVIISL